MKLATVVLGLLTVRLITEYISPEDFGQYKLIMSYALLLVGIFSRPLIQFYMRQYHELGIEHNYIFRNIKGLILTNALIFSLLAYLIDYQLGVFVALIYFTSSLFDLHRGYFITQGKQLKSELSNVIYKMAVLFLFLFLNFFVSKSVYYYHIIALEILSVLSSIVLINRSFFLCFSFDFINFIKLLKRNASYILPLIFIGVFSWVVTNSDRVILDYYAKPDDLGVYLANYGLISLPFLFINGLISQIFYSKLMSGNNKIEIFKRQLIFSFMLCFSCFIFIFFFYDLLSNIALGEDFHLEDVRIVMLLSSGYALFSFAMSFDLLSYKNKKTYRLLIINILSATSSLILNIYLIPIYGILGAAIGTFGSFLTYLILSIYYLFRDEFLDVSHKK